ncbi:hypothetical protein [Methyloceanibacter sp.]|uniref:hypothetical protein n=1 Tax=Methyloceanibacter sp. TaxID=1965321 RepID=UPI002D27A7CA|nr:hypothetical protein [Methyloceanibacter sp.]HZP08990.1 hypothetical protein [Methyloceanibacter sp.]
MLFLLRVIGVWLLLIAMVAAVVDATKSLAGGGAWVVTPMGEQWKALNAQSLDAAKAWVVSHAGPAVWDPVITSVLNAPTWVVFGILGVLLYWFGQKRKPVEIFIN